MKLLKLLIILFVMFLLSCGFNLSDLSNEEEQSQSNDSNEVHSISKTVSPQVTSTMSTNGTQLSILSGTFSNDTHVGLNSLSEEDFINSSNQSGVNIDIKEGSEYAAGTQIDLGENENSLEVNENLYISKEIDSINMESFDNEAIAEAIPSNAIPGAIPGAVPAFLKNSLINDFAMQAICFLSNKNNELVGSPYNMPLYLNDSQTFIVQVIPSELFEQGVEGGSKVMTALFAVSSQSDGINVEYSNNGETISKNINNLEELKASENTESHNTHFVKELGDLPECISKRDGYMYYVEELGLFKVCNNGLYTEVDLTGEKGDTGNSGMNGSDGENGSGVEYLVDEGNCTVGTLMYPWEIKDKENNAMYSFNSSTWDLILKNLYYITLDCSGQAYLPNEYSTRDYNGEYWKINGYRTYELLFQSYEDPSTGNCISINSTNSYYKAETFIPECDFPLTNPELVSNP